MKRQETGGNRGVAQIPFKKRLECRRAGRCFGGIAVVLLCVGAVLNLEAAWSGTKAPPAPKLSTLVGRVVDVETGRPIQGALVQVIGTQLEAVTDEHGSYTLSGVLTGRQSVRASGFDYSSVYMWADFGDSPKVNHANFKLRSTYEQFHYEGLRTSNHISPGFRLGPRITYFAPYGGMESYDSVGRLLLRTIEKQPYVALGVEAEYGPFLRVLRVKTELAHLRFYTHGGLELLTFPLSADLSIEPPVRWQVRPYAYFGGTLTSGIIGHSSLEDSLTLPVSAEEQVQAGIGFRYTLRSRMDIYTEVQLFSMDARNSLEAGFAVRDVVWGIGIDRVHVGVRMWVR